MSDTPTINRTAERTGGGVNGGLMLLVALGLLIGAIAAFAGTEGTATLGALALLVAILTFAGFYAVQPNQGVAITLFGNYKGTDRRTGLRWVVPWYIRKKISLRVRNVTSETLKV